MTNKTKDGQMTRNEASRVRREAIREAVAAGKPIRDITKAFRVSRQRIEQICATAETRHTNGEPIDGMEDIRRSMDYMRLDGRDPQLNHAEQAIILMRYAEGKHKRKTYVTVEQIAEYLGVLQSHVRQATMLFRDKEEIYPVRKKAKK